MEKTSNAVEILKRRYLTTPERQKSYEAENIKLPRGAKIFEEWTHSAGTKNPTPRKLLGR